MSKTCTLVCLVKDEGENQVCCGLCEDADDCTSKCDIMDEVEFYEDCQEFIKE